MRQYPFKFVCLTNNLNKRNEHFSISFNIKCLLAPTQTFKCHFVYVWEVEVLESYILGEKYCLQRLKVQPMWGETLHTKRQREWVH